jgi:hypothetical protein
MFLIIYRIGWETCTEGYQGRGGVITGELEILLLISSTYPNIKIIVCK